MRRVFRGLGIGLAVLIILVSVAISFTIGWRPFIGPRARPLTDRKFAGVRSCFGRGQSKT